MDDQGRTVFLCVGCREPIHLPRGGLRTEVIEYPAAGLCEINVSAAGRVVHSCAFTNPDTEISHIDIEG